VLSGYLALYAGAVADILDAAEWDLVSRGVRQRVAALERFLGDVYGPGRVFDDGVVPWRLAYTSGEFRREVAGFAPPNGVRVHVAATDLIRDEQGEFRVIEDNTRIPSCATRVAGFPSRLLAALRAAAPQGVVDPFVVMLTPGAAHSEHAAYAEHKSLARLLGVDLVEGRDLRCHRNHVYADTGNGRCPVDVVYRQVADDWLDPMHLRPESLLGCPGLINAARAGNVTIVNAVGNGVADGRLTYPYLPDLISYYLGEEPLLGNAESGRLPWHIGLRAFAVNDGRDVAVFPGGLTQAWERCG
jgi:uncharacterized circularly permuted ATP-grasp superfamily protein